MADVNDHKSLSERVENATTTPSSPAVARRESVNDPHAVEHGDRALALLGETRVRVSDEDVGGF